MSSVEYITSASILSNQASVTFSGIPATYTDLILESTAQVTANGASLEYLFNSDGAGNYSSTMIYQTTSVLSVKINNYGSLNTGTTNGESMTSLIYSPRTLHLFNYANTNVFKTALISLYTATGGYLGGSDITIAVGTWRSTSAISSVTVRPTGSRDIVAGSKFTLWGVK